MKAKRQHHFEPDYAVPPGATLEETMESLGMTQRDLGTRTGLTVQTLNRIFKGEQPITYETANKLELVTGIPAAFWNNLEAQYREQLTKIGQARDLETQIDWLKGIPVKDLVEREVLPDTRDKIVLLHETFRFFGVTSVDAWRNVWDCPKVAARRSTFFESSPGPTATWLRLGELQARETDCEPYDKERFADKLRAIRQLTVQSPEEFLPEMQRLCSEAGVALSLVPEIKKAPWSGAAMWLTPAKAMIVLNLRGKFEDRFWFTFFHEAGHILLGSKKATFIDDGKTYADDPEEKKADDFAAKTLIPLEFDSQIKAARSAAHIEKLAAGLEISPGIVAGRYQHLTKKWNHFNKLKRRFEWVEAAEGQAF
jgi:HTH-type transcriptional regulator/antitoxin HigA